MANTTLTYSSEVWTLPKKQQQRTETEETQFLRNVGGNILKDHIRHTRFRNKLNIFNPNNKIRNNRTH
jgi:hypothetical protein